MKKGVTLRKERADYLNVAKGTATKEWAFMGTGFTELNEEMGAKTSDKMYINESTSSGSIVGYESQFPFNLDVIKSELAIKFITEIGKYRKTGADAETQYVVVDLDEPVGEDKPNEFNARLFDVAVMMENTENNDGELTGSGNLKCKGDPVIGTFNTSTKKFEPTVTVGNEG